MFRYVFYCVESISAFTFEYLCTVFKIRSFGAKKFLCFKISKIANQPYVRNVIMHIHADFEVSRFKTGDFMEGKPNFEKICNFLEPESTLGGSHV